MRRCNELLWVYQSLLDCYGKQHWWPAESPFEVVVGAVLTQNTAWTNVEKAIAALRRAEALAPQTILGMAPPELEAYIRPAGFFRQKGATLQRLIAAIGNDLDRLKYQPLPELRRELLAIRGIGPETADAILLYAGNRATFVIDAYTRRLVQRLALAADNPSYDMLRQFFMANLPRDSQLYNEYHALIVVHAKARCRKRLPQCHGCPLLSRCHHLGAASI